MRAAICRGNGPLVRNHSHETSCCAAIVLVKGSGVKRQPLRRDTITPLHLSRTFAPDQDAEQGAKQDPEHGEETLRSAVESAASGCDRTVPIGADAG
ncbi:MAG: hypothetical protein C0478_08565 [Planctomyces sp.]|nr:hypothetical protein [Planctomyces sp.]